MKETICMLFFFTQLHNTLLQRVNKHVLCRGFTRTASLNLKVDAVINDPVGLRRLSWKQC